MDYEDLQQAYERLENKIENLKHLENVEHLVYAAPAVIMGIAVGFLVFGTGTGEVESQEKFEPKLTDYQKQYVDCPHRHIYICTRMSKLGTETVSFVDTSEGRIYLRYGGTDRLVARMPQNGTEGYLIRIDREYYQEESEASEESGSRETNSTESSSLQSEEINATESDSTESGNTTQTNSTQQELASTNQTASNSTQTG